MRDATGELADGLDLLALAQGFLRLAARGGLHRFGHHGGDLALVVQQRPEGELKGALAGGQAQLQLVPRRRPGRRIQDRLADDGGHAVGSGEPRRFAVDRPVHVLLGGQDGGQRGGVGVDDPAIQGQQVLVLEAGFEQRLQAAFAAMQGRGAFGHLLLERRVAGR